MNYQFVVTPDDTQSTHGKVISQIAPGSTVLELGCATGYITKYLTEDKCCKMHIVEYEQDAFTLAKPYAVSGVCADLNTPSWVDAFQGISFDYILFMDVLEHLYHPEQVLQEAVSLLKDDGTVLISLPNIAHNDILICLYNNAFNYMERGLLDSTHIRFFTKNKLLPLLGTAGLQLTAYDCTRMATGTTEQLQQHSYPIPEALAEALAAREDGDIYQFILTAKKQDYCVSHALACPLDQDELSNAAPAETQLSLLNQCEALRESLREERTRLLAQQDLMQQDVLRVLTSSWPNVVTPDSLTDSLNLLKQNIAALQQRNAALEQSLKANLEITKGIQQRCDFAESNLSLITNSRGHLMLSRYYSLREKLLPRGSLRFRFVRGLLRPIRALFRATRKNTVAQPVGPIFSPDTVDKDTGYLHMKSCVKMTILAVPHTVYVARMLQDILESVDIDVTITTEEPDVYEKIPYIIICPQNFKHFPDLYIAFQMEQTISDRWITEDYMEILRHAYAVFDYSLINIDYFRRDPVISSKIFYLPIDVCRQISNTYKYNRDCEKEYDVLFYGAPFSDHRQAFLQPIAERFNTKIVSEVFGDKLYEEMQKAKIIVNIHYYEDALLETTRLGEILSVCDTMVISESSNDPSEDARFSGLIDFVEIGNVQAMLDRIAYWLEHDDERVSKIQENRKYLEQHVNAAEFYLDRFLLANDRISFDYFYQTVGNFVQFNGTRICLSLPEATERRASFDQDNHYGFEIFNGLKHYLGWIGCGMSYKFIFRKAMEQKLSQIIICEDDTYFPDNFEERFAHVLHYTETHKDWNVFSGLMSDLGNVSIIDYAEEDDEKFVYLNRMISMVFNIYDESIFPLINAWDNTNLDIERNTIDRYLENISLRILTTNPFLIGHKEDLYSTLWGAQNTTYTNLIANSSIKLNTLVDDYLKQIH